MRKATLKEYLANMIAMLLLLLLTTGLIAWWSFVSVGVWWFPIAIPVTWLVIGLMIRYGHRQAIVCECGQFLFAKHNYCPYCGNSLKEI